MTKPVAFTLTMTAAVANAVCLSQTPAAGGVQHLTINGALASGGVATSDVPRHVSLTSTGNDSARTFVFYGADRYGNTISESLGGPNATTVKGTKNFATFTDITVDGNTVGAITVGTADELESKWIPMNQYADTFSLGINCVRSVGAGFTYGAEVCYEDVLADGFLEDDAHPIAHDTITGETTDQHGSQTTPITAIRFTMTAFTTGSLDVRLLQVSD